MDTKSLRSVNSGSDHFKKNFSMVFRQINSEITLKNLKEKNYVRMKHFTYITGPKYLNDYPISMEDFQTYEYQKVGEEQKV
jgi:hypothetical protein